MQLLTTITLRRSKDIARQTLGMYAHQRGHIRPQLALVKHDKLFRAGKRAVTRYLENTRLGRQFRLGHAFDRQRLWRVGANKRFNRRLFHITCHLRLLKISSLPETRAKVPRAGTKLSGTKKESKEI